MKVDLKKKYWELWNKSPENVALSLVHNYTLSFRQCVAAMTQTDIAKRPLGYLMSEAYFRERKYALGTSYLIPVMEHVFRFYECENEPDIIKTHPPKQSDMSSKETIAKIIGRYHRPLDMLLSREEIRNVKSDNKALRDAIVQRDIDLRKLPGQAAEFAQYLYAVSAACPAEPPDYGLSVDVYHTGEQGYGVFQDVLNDYGVPVLTLDEIVVLNQYGMECVEIEDVVCRVSDHENSRLAQKLSGLSGANEAGRRLMEQLKKGIRYSPPWFLE